MFFFGEKQRMRRSLEGRWLPNFLHRSAVIRWMIVLGSLAALIGLALFGGRMEPVDLTVGQRSPRTIVARVNFSYLDERATSEERDRKADAAPNVYRLSLDSFQRNLTRTEHLMDRVHQLKQGGRAAESKLKQIADIWNEGTEFPLEAVDVQTLLSIPDRRVFVERLKKLAVAKAEAGIVGDDQFSSPETTIAFGVRPDDFTRLRMARTVQLPTATQARQQLMEELAAAAPFPQSASKTVERIVTDLVAPNLQLDLRLSTRLQERQKRGVEPVYANGTKGGVLIDRGELVTEEKLAMLKAHENELERQFSSESRWHERLATALLVAVIVGLAALVLRFGPFPGQEWSNRENALLAAITILHFGLCRLALFLGEAGGLSPSLIPSILPVCFGPVMIAILLDHRRAHVAAFVCSFLLGVITQFSFAVMLAALVSSVIGIHFVTPLRRRSKIYEAGLMAGLTAAAVAVIFGGTLDVPFAVLGMQSCAAVLAGFVTSVLVSALLPLFEGIFKVTTDLRWLELSDLNHPLLKRMVMEAPGTYHHSLVVANLAERACEGIGANALQARVCSYFHDIGKLKKPEYFCENQVAGENPHDDLTPSMSALVIIAHVKDGVDMALEHRMARAIVRTIQQHHGTSQVAYFYRVARRQEEDARLGSRIMKTKESDVPRVDEETFRYPGPKPRTREIAVISLADALEGASRSMQKPTPQKIEALVAEIIEERARDGQLDDCPLSFSDLRVVADSFSKTLLSMMHARVSYPRDEPDIDQPAPFPSAADQ